VHVEEHWRVAHALIPRAARLARGRRDVTDPLDDLDPTRRRSRRLMASTRARCAVTGASKAYAVFFAEAEGFAHLHVHVVPRMPWFTPEQVGPRVFGFLGASDADRVPYADQDALALRLRESLVQGS
jgi:diadenosine tetraphosphate (Ap4A) HIT family hydrolase